MEIHNRACIEEINELNRAPPVLSEIIKESREAGYEACYAQSKVIINGLLADLSEARLSLQSVKNARLWVEQD